MKKKYDLNICLSLLQFGVVPGSVQHGMEREMSLHPGVWTVHAQKGAKQLHGRTQQESLR